MDLISYYAMHGPKKSRSSGSAAKSSADTTKDATTPIGHGRPEQHGDKASESDIEEDDGREINSEELGAFMRQLRFLSIAEKAKLLEFNRTHPVECTTCLKQNVECRLSRTSPRCEGCFTRHRSCSRTIVFQQWMIRHKFNLSWEKADEVLKSAPDIASSAEVRTSPRTPVPRVRKPPAGISVPIDAPALVRERSRPLKRLVVSVPPRADRKRRKIALEIKPDPKPEQGRVILPAPSSPETRKQVLERKETKRTSSGTQAGSRAVLDARVTATEERLDAIEARLQMPRLGHATRQSVVRELGRAIADLEGDGNVQSAIQRMRALHTSLLEDEDVIIPDPSEGLLDGEQNQQLPAVEQEDYFVDDAVVNDLNGGETILADSDTVLGDDTEAAFLAVAENGASSA
ncbi:hypothetical protein FB451DRAFT_432467 [Mycena latifolia]|nr:hypothetical protein FB451DRAFT_432467 [Mycena latifolia]